MLVARKTSGLDRPSAKLGQLKENVLIRFYLSSIKTANWFAHWRALHGMQLEKLANTLKSAFNQLSPVKATFADRKIAHGRKFECTQRVISDLLMAR